MPAVLLETQIALVPIKDNVKGVFFSNVGDYLDQLATTAESVVLSNGVKIIGVEVHAPDDDNLIHVVKVRFDDSAALSEWVPSIGTLAGRPFIKTAINQAEKHKVAIMVVDNQTPIEGNVVTLILA